MHKLVAYAYLQGETGSSGRVDDEGNIVTQVGADGCWPGGTGGAGRGWAGWAGRLELVQQTERNGSCSSDVLWI